LVIPRCWKNSQGSKKKNSRRVRQGRSGKPDHAGKKIETKGGMGNFVGVKK